MARIVNDVHSRLNEARVAEIDRPKSLAELQRSIAHASRTVVYNLSERDQLAQPVEA